MIKKSFAYYIIGLILFVTLLISLTYNYVENRYQKDILTLYETYKDRDARIVIKSLIDNEVEKLSALSKSLRERDDLTVEIAVSSVTDQNLGALKTVMDALAKDLSLGICQVTDKKGRVIYDPHAPEKRGQYVDSLDIKSLMKGENLLVEASETAQGWAIRAVVPAFVGREFFGSIVIGTWINDEFASSFSRATGNQVTIGTKDAVIASSIPLSERATRIDPMDIARSFGENTTVRNHDPGINTVAYYKPMRILDKDFVFIDEFDTSEFAQLNSVLQQRHMRITGFFTLVALLVGAILTLKLVSPLKKLKSKAEKTAREITNREMASLSKNEDEVNSLISSFGIMVDTIKEHFNERTKMEENLRQAKQDWENTFNSITDIITIHDKNFNIVLANKAAEESLKLPGPAEANSKCFLHYHGKHTPPKECPSCECAVANKPSTCEVFEPHLGMHIEVRAIPRLDSSGNSTGVIHIVRDISERKKMEEELIKQALYDSLTGLPNRFLFMDRLLTLFNRRQRHKEMLFAVFFIDLDRFKKINDGLGHLFGDELLIAVANRFKECIRPGDTVSRFGGDEFAMLADDIHDTRDSTEIAERILESLKKPFNIRGHEVFSSASIGISVIDSRYRNIEEFLRDADIAMYHAKGMGRARFAVFDPEMHETAVQSMRLENDLRKAIDRSEFVLHYQPILDIENGSVSGFEALIRWLHPSFGVIMPDGFIHAAEETGLIVPIGEWVLREACRQIKAWQDTGAFTGLTLSVNLSAKQFTEDLPFLVKRIIEDTGVNHGTLNLEITESALMRDQELALEIISRLKDMNVRVLLDDFGTGFSSLNYIHKFPVDALKIDRSFVKNICNDREAREIVRAIASLAHNLGIQMIVEGVETVSQLEMAKSLKCKLSQGFYFSRPLESGPAFKYLSVSPRHGNA